MSKIKSMPSASELVTFTLLACILWNSASAHSLDEIKSELRDVSSSGGNDVSSGMALRSISDITRRSLMGNHRNMWPIYGIAPKMFQTSQLKIPIELDLLVENDDSNRSKRFDDYGHMRFGKRGGEEQFDDYGHMRFGRST